MRARCKGPTIGVSLRGTMGAAVVGGVAVSDENGIRVTFSTPKGPVNVRTQLLGDFNLENVALAVGIGVAADLPVEAIEEGLARVTGVAGRLRARRQ